MAVAVLFRIFAVMAVMQGVHGALPQEGVQKLTPEDIEKLICKFATHKEIEDRATKAVCEKIQTKFPKYQFEHPCEIVLEKLWDKAISQCPQLRATFPTPENIEKLICKFATQQEIEDRATKAVCEKIQTKFPQYQFEHPCEIVLEKLWDKAVTKCPQLQATFPTPAEVEKLICKFATKQEIEDRATKAVCEKIQAKFPQYHFEHPCEIVLEKLWDKAVTKCPQLQAILPTPAEIEKLICKFATQQEIEDRATKAVCEKIQAKFPQYQFEHPCEIVLEKLWDKAVAKCPQLQAIFPTPADIEKLICKFATQQEIEDRATKAVCEKIQAKFPKYQFEHPCEIVLERLWDTAVAKCPQRRETITPADIEKLLCKFATKKEIEDRATKAVCEKIQAKFPKYQFEQRCEVVLEKVWEKAVEKCTQGPETFPTPEEIEKLICEVASKKDIEDRATNAVCEKIQAKFPKYQFEHPCEIVLEKLWNKAVSKCPQEAVVIV